MNQLRKSLAAAALSGAVVAGIFGSSTLVRSDGNQAFAQESSSPAQGKVQAPVEASPQEQQHLEGLSSIFRKVGKSVEPAVVQINVRKTTRAARPPGYDDMLRRFFPDNDRDGQPDVPDDFNDGGGGGGGGGEFRQEGTGSGVIMEVNGSEAFILTNNHVAGGATEILVVLNDGRRIEGGSVVGADPKTDLAVVKIKADGLVAAPWGDSDKLEKGDWIMAFGSPFGYVGSMTHGIVSALNRRAGILGNNGYENFIQVDAPINPGNSGGPLVNTRGEVVGINTAIASRSGGFQGIGFSVPSNQAKFVYTALKSNGKVTRGWLGVKIGDVAEQSEVARSYGYDQRDGVLVVETFPGTPALGKLQPGDIVTSLAGRPVKNTQELRNAIAATPPGTDLKLTVFRDGKSQDVTLNVAEQPEDPTLAIARGVGPDGKPNADAEARGTVLGMKLATPDDRLAQEYALGETRQGAVITDVERNSAAAKAGLQKGDVITRVFNTDVLTAKQAAEELGKVDKNKPIRLYVTNAEGSRFVVIKPAS